MIRAILNINTFMLMFLILILLADYAAFFGINPSFAPQPLFSGQIIEAVDRSLKATWVMVQLY